jgi:hypothetical protein
VFIEINKAMVKNRNGYNADYYQKYYRKSIGCKIYQLGIVRMQVFINSKCSLQKAKQPCQCHIDFVVSDEVKGKAYDQ